jgi:tripartite-type tricarboxylate transporter receptor subunit TctC
MAGRVHVYIESLSALAGAIAGAQIKPLAVTSKQRLPNRADLPTVAETIPEFAAMGWFALMAPPATPQIYALKVSNDLRTALARPGLLQRFLELGTYTRPMSPAELKDFIQQQQQIWRPVINELSLQTPK